MQDTNFWAGLDTADTTIFPTKDKTRSMNEWYRIAVSWIWQSVGTWDFDDRNYTNLPIVTTTLVAAQSDYGLPSTAHKITRVEVLDNNSNYKLLTPIDKSKITRDALTEYMETDGLPKFYDLEGDSIWLYPAPAAAQVTLAAGLKIYLSRDVSVFASTDTTKEPGFKPESCHRILSLGAAMDFTLANFSTETNKIARIRDEIERLKLILKEFHGSKEKEAKIKFEPRVRFNI